MEVQIDKRYPIAASVEQAWAVLADIRATAACMPGAQITEQVDATHYKGTVRSKVGPAVMSFAGDIEVQAVDAAARRVQMLGKGADRGGSSAAMNLTATVEAGDGPGSSVLVGLATVTVSGKLAQFGSRLLVPVSEAMLAQFAGNFQNAAAAVALAAPEAAVAAPAGAEADAVTPSTTEEPVAAAATVAPEVAAVAPPVVTPKPVPAPPPPMAPAPVQELNALGLMWTVFKGWLAGLFGKKSV